MLLFYIIHKIFAEHKLRTSPTIMRRQFRTITLVALMSPNTQVRELLLFVGNSPYVTELCCLSHSVLSTVR